MLVLTNIRYLDSVMTRIMKSLGYQTEANKKPVKFFLELKLILHFTRKQTNFRLTFDERNCALRGRHYKYSYGCTVAATHFIRSHVWF